MKQLELCADGRVIIRAKTDEWVLRVPTLGEYRTLVTQADDADRSFREQIEAAGDALPEGSTATQISDARNAMAAALQMGTDDRDPHYGLLIQGWVAMLCEKDPPDVSDLPSFAITGATASRLLSHWRAVPLDLGQLV